MDRNDKDDFLERLEILDKVLGMSAIVFWLLSFISVESRSICYIGIMLPFIGFSLEKPVFVISYAVGTIIYVVVSAIITQQPYCFVPHLACCVCVIGESLMTKISKEVNKCRGELTKIKKLYETNNSRLLHLKTELSSIKQKTFNMTIEQQAYDDETDEVILLARNKVMVNFCYKLLNDVEECEKMDRDLYQ